MSTRLGLTCLAVAVAVGSLLPDAPVLADTPPPPPSSPGERSGSATAQVDTPPPPPEPPQPVPPGNDPPAAAAPEPRSPEPVRPDAAPAAPRTASGAPSQPTAERLPVATSGPRVPGSTRRPDIRPPLQPTLLHPNPLHLHRFMAVSTPLHPTAAPQRAIHSFRRGAMVATGTPLHPMP